MQVDSGIPPGLRRRMSSGSAFGNGRPEVAPGRDAVASRDGGRREIGAVGAADTTEANPRVSRHPLHPALSREDACS